MLKVIWFVCCLTPRHTWEDMEVQQQCSHPVCYAFDLKSFSVLSPSLVQPVNSIYVMPEPKCSPTSIRTVVIVVTNSISFPQTHLIMSPTSDERKQKEECWSIKVKLISSLLNKHRTDPYPNWPQSWKESKCFQHGHWDMKSGLAI